MKKRLVFLLVILPALLGFVACYYNQPYPLEYGLFITTEGQGTVEPNSGIYLSGRILAFNIEAAPGWEFDRWDGRNRGDMMKISNQWQVLVDREIKATAVFVETGLADKYYLSVRARGGGTVNPGSGNYSAGTRVVLTTYPSLGYTFSHWEGSSNHEVGRDGDNWSIYMNGDKEVIAVFTILNFNLNINILGQGKVEHSLVNTSNPDNLPPNSQVNLKAIPDPGWTFREWLGDVRGTNPITQIFLDGHKNITAIFEESSTNLEITVIGQGHVEEKLISNNDYPQNSLVRLWAKADSGWSFQEWLGDAYGQEPIFNIRLDGPKAVTAVFVEEEKKLDITVIGRGTVQEKLTRGTDYPANSEVRLWATPEDGWYFKEWRGDARGTSPIIYLEMDEDKKITAIFEEEDDGYYWLELEIEGEGSVTRSPRGDDYPEGTKVTLTARPDKGWFFKNWRGDLTGSDSQIQIIMDGHKSITAVFIEKEEDYYYLDVQITGRGTVSKNPDRSEYQEGTTVTLTANPDNGWQFQEWQGDLSGTSSQTQIRMTSDKEVRAIFNQKEDKRYNLTINITGCGKVTKSPDSADYPAGTVVSLTAAADPGWRFVSWQGDISGTNSRMDITIDRHKNVVAVFEMDSGTGFTLSATAAWTNQGSVTKEPNSTYYAPGSVVTLTGVPASGYIFAYWRGDASGNNSVVQITMDSNKKVQAYFWYDAG